MNIKKYVLLMIIFIPFSIKALSYGGCDYKTLSNMKSLVTNINISYDYNMINNVPYFTVTLENIPQDVYFTDNQTGIKYDYSNTVNGELVISNYNNITGGKYSFYSNNINCLDINVGYVFYTFPTYNKYYNDNVCKGVEDYKLCNKWTKNPYNYEEFVSNVEKYKESLNKDSSSITIEKEETILNKIVKFYINYYIYILIFIIIVSFILSFVLNRKNRFKI